MRKRRSDSMGNSAHVKHEWQAMSIVRTYLNVLGENESEVVIDDSHLPFDRHMIVESIEYLFNNNLVEILEIRNIVSAYASLADFVHNSWIIEARYDEKFHGIISNTKMELRSRITEIVLQNSSYNPILFSGETIKDNQQMFQVPPYTPAPLRGFDAHISELEIKNRGSVTPILYRYSIAPFIILPTMYMIWEKFHDSSMGMVYEACILFLSVMVGWMIGLFMTLLIIAVSDAIYKRHLRSRYLD